MKIAMIVVRTLMGLLFLFGSISYFLKLIPQPELFGAMKVFNAGLDASVYLIPTVKVIELICGLAFLSGRFVPLASILIAPIIVNIFFIHVFLAPEGLPVALFVVFGNLFLAYTNRKVYAPLFVSK